MVRGDGKVHYRANSLFIIFKKLLLLWGYILPYPKDGLVQRKHIRRARSLARGKQLLVSNETFDRQTASRERLVLLLYDFLFSVNTITYTYHPLFELFFHRSYLKTTTIIESFSLQCYLMVFHWRQRDSKSIQVSRILFSILANLSNAIVRMVSTRSLISNPSRPLLPGLPIIISIIITFTFPNLFNFFVTWNHINKNKNEYN